MQAQQPDEAVSQSAGSGKDSHTHAGRRPSLASRRKSSSNSVNSAASSSSTSSAVGPSRVSAYALRGLAEEIDRAGLSHHPSGYHHHHQHHHHPYAHSYAHSRSSSVASSHSSLSATANNSPWSADASEYGDHQQQQNYRSHFFYHQQQELDRQQQQQYTQPQQQYPDIYAFPDATSGGVHRPPTAAANFEPPPNQFLLPPAANTGGQQIHQHRSFSTPHLTYSQGYPYYATQQQQQGANHAYPARGYSLPSGQMGLAHVSENYGYGNEAMHLGDQGMGLTSFMPEADTTSASPGSTAGIHPQALHPSTLLPSHGTAQGHAEQLLPSNRLTSISHPDAQTSATMSTAAEAAAKSLTNLSAAAAAANSDPQNDSRGGSATKKKKSLKRGVTSPSISASQSIDTVAGDLGIAAIMSNLATAPPLAELAEAINRVSKGSSASSTEKIKITFVHHWLARSFILHPEGNVARQALYSTYLEICQYYNFGPLNAASFGKAVRSAYPGIKTRRLGVRGQSRYHFCGLRASNRETEELVIKHSAFPDDHPSASGSMSATGKKSRTSSVSSGNSSERDAFETFPGSDNDDDDDDEFRKPLCHTRSASQTFLNSTTSGRGSIVLEKLELIHPPRGARTQAGHPGPSHHPANGAITAQAASAKAEEGSEQGSHPAANGLVHSLGDMRDTEMTDSESEREDPAESDTDYDETGQRSSAFAFLTTAGKYRSADAPDDSGYSGTLGDPSGSIEYANQRDSSELSAALRLSLGDCSELDGHADDADEFGDLRKPHEPETSALYRTKRQFSVSDLVRNTHDGDDSMSAPPTACAPDFSFADLKTPTARHFLQSSSIATVPTGPFTSSTPIVNDAGDGVGETPSLLAGPISDNLGDSAEADQHDSGWKLSSSEHPFKSARIDNDQPSIGIDPRGLILRDPKRRSTVPDLSISIPPPYESPSLRHADSAYPASTVELASSQHLSQDLSDGLIARTTAAKGDHRPLEGLAEKSQLEDGSLGLQVQAFAAVVASGDPSQTESLDVVTAEFLWDQYRNEHCQGLLKIVSQMRYEEFEAAMMLYWASLNEHHRQVVQHPLLSEAMYRLDAAVYECLLSHVNEGLFSKPFGAVEHHDFMALQKLASNLEQYAVNALNSFPAGFVSGRVELASRTAHLLSRHLGMVQLAQAVSGVLSQPENAAQLLAGWDSIDFDTIFNQAALVTNCAQDLASHFCVEFRKTLALLGKGGEPLRILVAFADAAMSHGLAELAQSRRSVSKETNARTFLLKWSFVSSQITRDLTIKSNPTFGAFQLVSLFIEEWLASKILKEVALQANAVTASVAAEAENVAAVKREQDQFKPSGYAASAFPVSPSPATLGFQLAKAPDYAQAQGRAVSAPTAGGDTHSAIQGPSLASFPNLDFSAASTIAMDPAGYPAQHGPIDPTSNRENGRPMAAAAAVAHAAAMAQHHHTHQMHASNAAAAAAVAAAASGLPVPPSLAYSAVATSATAANFASILSPNTRAIFGAGGLGSAPPGSGGMSPFSASFGGPHTAAAPASIATDPASRRASTPATAFLTSCTEAGSGPPGSALRADIKPLSLASTPIFLNFSHHMQPTTPSALAMQFSPRARQFTTTTTSTSFSFDDFHLPLPSPARLPTVGHTYR